MNRPLDDIEEARNPLKELIENLRDGKAVNLSVYRDSYQSWTIKRLREVLKADFFQPDEIMKVAQNYWLLNLYEGVSETRKATPYEILREDWDQYSDEMLERLFVLQKLAQILFPVLKKYWDRKRIIDADLDMILEDSEQYPWHILINCQIPPLNAIKTDAE